DAGAAARPSQDGPGPRPSGEARTGAVPAGDRPAGPALARPRLRRRHHGQGAGRNRRAARAPHPRRASPPLRRELPPATGAGIYRAAAKGLLIFAPTVPTVLPMKLGKPFTTTWVPSACKPA